jgi:hypothetical protein
LARLCARSPDAIASALVGQFFRVASGKEQKGIHFSQGFAKTAEIIGAG